MSAKKEASRKRLSTVYNTLALVNIKIVMEFASYITGFVDGEGCFCISFNRRDTLNTRIEVRPSFSVSQKKHSLSALQAIQKYFACGGIRYSSRDGTYKYEVRSLEDLNRIIIPHFQKYPLQTAEGRDFELFSSICTMMKSNLHRNTDCLKEILELAFKMNVCGTRRYSKIELLKLSTR